MTIPNNGAGFTGFQKPGSGSTDYNATTLLVSQLLSKVSTCTLVQVKAVTNSGGLSPVGFVDILPLVNQIDGKGNSVPHATIYHCPYVRLQGGGNAVILDPQVGDIGLAAFASRDVSSVIANKAQSNPGSYRRFDMSDGLYLGGMLNGTPTQYVQFNTSGITIHSPTAVILNAPDVQIQCTTFEMNASTSATITTPNFTVNAASSTFNGNETINGITTLNGPLAQHTGTSGSGATMQGPLTVTNDVTAVGTSLHTHIHTDPQGGTTSAPI